jgi:hypothetical protein
MSRAFLDSYRDEHQLFECDPNVSSSISLEEKFTENDMNDLLTYKFNQCC